MTLEAQTVSEIFYPRVSPIGKLETLLNISISTSKIHELTVHKPRGDFNLRPQMHVFISAPMGNFKTSILQIIERDYPSSTYKLQMSAAALRGTFDKNTGEPIGFLAWEVRHGVLLVDEFANDSRGQLLRAFLALTENSRYDFSLGLRTAKIERFDDLDKNLYLKIENGNVQIKTRFAAIFASMYSLKYLARSMKIAALLDRCVPIQNIITGQDKKRVKEGEQIFATNPFAASKKIIVGLEAYELISDYADKKYSNWLNLRAVNDCIRAFAVIQEHNLPLYDYILESHWYLDQAREEIAREKEQFGRRY